MMKFLWCRCKRSGIGLSVLGFQRYIITKIQMGGYPRLSQVWYKALEAKDKGVQPTRESRSPQNELPTASFVPSNKACFLSLSFSLTSFPSLTHFLSLRSKIRNLFEKHRGFIPIPFPEEPRFPKISPPQSVSINKMPVKFTCM